jgi:hypothetical protein
MISADWNSARDLPSPSQAEFNMTLNPKDSSRLQTMNGELFVHIFSLDFAGSGVTSTRGICQRCINIQSIEEIWVFSLPLAGMHEGISPFLFDLSIWLRGAQ